MTATRHAGPTVRVPAADVPTAAVRTASPGVCARQAAAQTPSLAGLILRAGKRTGLSACRFCTSARGRRTVPTSWQNGSAASSADGKG